MHFLFIAFCLKVDRHYFLLKDVKRPLTNHRAFDFSSKVKDLVPG